MYENLPSIETCRRIKNVYGNRKLAFNMWENGIENSKELPTDGILRNKMSNVWPGLEWWE